jgi:hypothetical protein
MISSVHNESIPIAVKGAGAPQATPTLAAVLAANSLRA